MVIIGDNDDRDDNDDNDDNTDNESFFEIFVSSFFSSSF